MRDDIIPAAMPDSIVPGITDCQGPLHPQAVYGMELFNQGRYFEAHEALEAAWRDESGPVRDLYRGILQVHLYEVFLLFSVSNPGKD